MYFQEKLDGELIGELGNKLKGLRKQHKMSQQQVANHIGVSRKHLSDVETGKANSLITFIKLLRLFNKYRQLEASLESKRVSPKEKYRESQK